MKKIHRSNSVLINPTIDMENDIELSTYIDARERYDYLNSLSEEIVANKYYEKNQS